MAVKFRDYYEVLGVPRTASAGEIKSAYRRLARKMHPDLQPASERAKASETFKEINEAYEVLKDPKKRAKYDALGENWKGGQDFTPPPGTEWSGGGGTPWENLGDFSDFFAAIFGEELGGSRRRTRARTGSRIRWETPGAPIEAEMPVSLEELLRGGKRRISLDGNRVLDVEIPLGVRDGTVLRLAGQGGQGTGGAPPGDLFLRLRLQPDPRYRTDGDDFEMDLALWPWQAVLGSEVRIETPDGAVKLKVPAGTRAGTRMRLRGRGLPRPGGERGDLYAVTRIVVPERPQPAEREAYEALQRSSPHPPDRPAEE
jgi:curved DNA-binding protein